jgi:hypothetical protein
VGLLKCSGCLVLIGYVDVNNVVTSPPFLKCLTRSRWGVRFSGAVSNLVAGGAAVLGGSKAKVPLDDPAAGQDLALSQPRPVHGTVSAARTENR